MTVNHLEALDKIQAKIETLQAENEKDQAKLIEKEAAYEKAVVQFESKKVDILHQEIEQIKSNMANRNKQISILGSKDNPVRKDAINNYLADLYNNALIVKKEAKEMEKKLQAARRNYIESLKQAEKMNRRHNLETREHHRESIRLGVISNDVYHYERDVINLYQFEVKKDDIFGGN